MSAVDQEPVYVSEDEDKDTVKRTPEELEDLRVRQQQLRDRYQPLLEKAKRQLRRAEQSFLEADDRKEYDLGEAIAIRELYYAQEITDYYQSIMSDINYAYTVGDLDWHQV